MTSAWQQASWKRIRHLTVYQLRWTLSFARAHAEHQRQVEAGWHCEWSEVRYGMAIAI